MQYFNILKPQTTIPYSSRLEQICVISNFGNPVGNSTIVYGRIYVIDITYIHIYIYTYMYSKVFNSLVNLTCALM